jgi:ribonuclease Z
VKVVEIASSESANRNPKQKPHGSLVHSGIVEEGTIVETSTHVVSCARIVHRPGLDAYGFVVEEVALPRKVLVEEARRAGLTPGPLYQHLQAGQDVVLSDGTVIRADDVTQENVRPRKVVIVGDTCDASALVPLAENADIVVHEATLEDEQWILARRHGHSTAGGAGRFAAKAKAKALILTHMSSRHHSVKHLERLREQARKSFGRQEVVLGRDFMAVPVPRGGFTT